MVSLIVRFEATGSESKSALWSTTLYYGLDLAYCMTVRFSFGKINVLSCFPFRIVLIWSFVLLLVIKVVHFFIASLGTYVYSALPLFCCLSFTSGSFVPFLFYSSIHCIFRNLRLLCFAHLFSYTHTPLFVCLSLLIFIIFCFQVPIVFLRRSIMLITRQPLQC